MTLTGAARVPALPAAAAPSRSCLRSWATAPASGARQLRQCVARERRSPAPLPAAAASAAAAASNGAASNGADSALRDLCEVTYLSGRAQRVSDHFPAALGLDDFMHRLEVALYAFGFSGDNTITMVNLCRDEITLTLKHKIDSVFGAAFNVNGLGGVLTCGVSGVAAGLSHAPVSRGSGKERYVFFSFPHISIDARGAVGAISRPGRPGASCACGALNKALVDIRQEGLTSNCKIPGVHDARDPEFSILKQRLARRLRFEGAGEDAVGALTLVDITQVAERTITDDLEYLISQTVDPSRADYAVVAGVQIHSWGAQFDDDSPNLEFVAPTSVYVVVNGEREYLDLNAMPSLTPRQVRLLARQSESGGAAAGRGAGVDDGICNTGGSGTLREVEPPYLYNSQRTKRRERQRADIYADLLAEEGLRPQMACSWPSWQSTLRAGAPHRGAWDTSVVIDETFATDDELEGMWARLQDKYLAPDMSHSQAPDSSSGGGGGSSKGAAGGVVGAAAAVPPPARPHSSRAGSEGATPKAGLLLRLLRTMKAGKERQSAQQQQQRDERQ